VPAHPPTLARTLGLECLELLEEAGEVDDDAVAEEACAAGVDEPGGEEVEREGAAVGDDRVSGVVPARAARADVGVGGEDVDELALALVAPLRAEDDGDCQAPPVSRGSRAREEGAPVMVRGVRADGVRGGGPGKIGADGRAQASASRTGTSKSKTRNGTSAISGGPARPGPAAFRSLRHTALSPQPRRPHAFPSVLVRAEHKR
jgi:hypothetical protein